MFKRIRGGEMGNIYPVMKSKDCLHEEWMVDLFKLQRRNPTTIISGVFYL